MNNDEYRKFWKRLLGRYPEFNPTKQQTEDWHRELNHLDRDLIEASVSTIIKKYTSGVPKLPWIINTYYSIKEDRVREQSSVQERRLCDQSWEEILEERRQHTQQLKDTDINDLRNAVATVVKKYKPIIKMPNDGDIETWSPWLRASVWCNLYG